MSVIKEQWGISLVPTIGASDGKVALRCVINIFRILKGPGLDQAQQR